MGLTVRPYLAIINLSVATGFRTPILFGRLPTGSLYSLEKLIEWKLQGPKGDPGQPGRDLSTR